MAAACSSANVDRLLAGKAPEGVPDELAGRLLKVIGYKAPLAIRLANEIIDRQAELPIDAAVEVELGRLESVFSTADAHEGLSSVLQRRRPAFRGC